MHDWNAYLIPLKTIVFTYKDPLTVIRRIEYRIVKNSKLETLLKWGGWNLSENMAGYVKTDKSEFILNPTMKRWFGNSRSCVSIWGKLANQDTLKVTLNLSIRVLINAILSIFLFVLIPFLPPGISNDTLVQIFMVLAFCNIVVILYTVNNDLRQTEKQLTELLELSTAI